jgi:nitrite reductase (NADH) small subunit
MTPAAEGTPGAPGTFDLGPVAGIPRGEGRLFRIGGLTVAVFRTRGEELFATQPWCPHRQGPLADGIVAAGRVICPLHSYPFDLASGRALGHDCGPLATYDVGLGADGHVHLRVPLARTEAPCPA